MTTRDDNSAKTARGRAPTIPLRWTAPTASCWAAARRSGWRHWGRGSPRPWRWSTWPAGTPCPAATRTPRGCSTPSSASPPGDHCRGAPAAPCAPCRTGDSVPRAPTRTAATARAADRGARRGRADGEAAGRWLRLRRPSPAVRSRGCCNERTAAPDAPARRPAVAALCRRDRGRDGCRDAADRDVTYLMAVGSDTVAWVLYGLAGVVTLAMPAIPWYFVRDLRALIGD